MDYFGKDQEIFFPTSRIQDLTELRKIGDQRKQYVTSVRMRDKLICDSDGDIYFDGDTIVYEEHAGNCDVCEENMKRIAKNELIGVRIYPKGKYPTLSFQERKQIWVEYDRFNFILGNK